MTNKTSDTISFEDLEVQGIEALSDAFGLDLCDEGEWDAFLGDLDREITETVLVTVFVGLSSNDRDTFAMLFNELLDHSDNDIHKESIVQFLVDKTPDLTEIVTDELMLLMEQYDDMFAEVEKEAHA